MQSIAHISPCFSSLRLLLPTSSFSLPPNNQNKYHCGFHAWISKSPPSPIFPIFRERGVEKKANYLTQGHTVVVDPKIMMLRQPFSADTEPPTDPRFSPFSLLGPPAAFSVGYAPGTSTSLHDLTASPSLLSLDVSKHSGEQDLVFLVFVP